MYRVSVILLVFVLSITLRADAQFQKGMRMTGGSLGAALFNSGKTDYTSGAANTNGYTSKTQSAGIDLSPNLGWFITDNTVLGGRIIFGYQYEKTSDMANDVTFRRNTYHDLNARLGVFLRRYIGGATNLLPYAQVDVDGGIGSSDSEGFFYGSNYRENYKGKSSGTYYANAGIAFGFTKLLTERAGIDVQAGYLFSYGKKTYQTDSFRDIDSDGTIDEEGVEKITTKATNNGLAISVGFQLFLGRK